MTEKIGKYEVVDQIGRGGMGTIFRARDPILQRLVALKVISDVEITPELRMRFFREAQACARIAHPNIVIVHDMGEDNGRLYIVMELLEGEELRRVIARQAEVSLKEKIDIVRQICDGLHFAHQKGVIHRDIKPANILVLRTGQVKILDFGIAHIASAVTQRDLTRTGMFMGTLRYMAPEQVRGHADPRSDMFSVGAVAYELFSGHPQFSGNDPLQILEQLRTATPPRLTELDASLPSALADVIDRALQKDPADRFADLDQMSRELQSQGRELAGDERPMARPSALLGLPGPVVNTARPTTAHDSTPVIGDPPVAAEMAEAAEPQRQSDEMFMRENDRLQVAGIPRIAIGTGVVLVAVAIVALYAWRPTAPRVPVGNEEAAVAPARSAAKTETASEPANPVPKRDDAARSVPDTPQQPERAQPPSRSSPAAASASKTDRVSVTPREPNEPAALDSASARARDNAEQARSRATAARQAAERVAAGFYARNRFLSAQTKERQALAALGKSDYVTGSALFAEAQSEYQAATIEAPREEENQRKVAALNASLDQAHAAAAARRQEALTAQADQLARELFDQAQARQVEADGLASRKDLAAAARAYQEAAARYGEAAARARALRPAR